MRLQFFNVERDNGLDMFIAARDSDHAAEIFVTWDVATGSPAQEFSLERYYRKLPADMRIGLDDMLNHGVTGIAAYDHLLGWAVHTPI